MRNTIIRFAAAALIAALPLLAACGGGDDDDDDTNGAQPSATTGGNPGGIPANLLKVTVGDNKFSPANLQVPVGANVTWEWTGNNPHSVVGTFDGKEIQSPRLTGTGVYVEAFQKAGLFEYHCGVHGAAMSGKITIQ